MVSWNVSYKNEDQSSSSSVLVEHGEAGEVREQLPTPRYPLSSDLRPLLGEIYKLNTQLYNTTGRDKHDKKLFRWYIMLIDKSKELLEFLIATKIDQIECRSRQRITFLSYSAPMDWQMNEVTEIEWFGYNVASDISITWNESSHFMKCPSF